MDNYASGSDVCLKQKDCGSMTQQKLHVERFEWSNRKGSKDVVNHFQNDNRNDERDRNNEYEYSHSSDDCRDDKFQQRQVDLLYKTELRERSSYPSVPAGAINMDNYASGSDVYERSTLYTMNNNDSREMPKVIIKSISKGWVPKEELTISERLYNRSEKLQKDGKKRREDIAQASMQRQISRTPKDYGTLPASKATDVYVRGIRSLNKKEARLEEKRRRNSKYGSTNRRGCQLHSDISREMSGTQIFTSGKLPLSKASDMYDRSMRLLIAKQILLQRIRPVEIKHDREKLPLSRAHNMYERSARNNLVKEATREKLSSSRACDMYRQSLRDEKAKHQKIEQRIALDRKKEEEIRLTRLQERRKRRKQKEMIQAIASYDSKESATPCIFSVGIPSKSKRVTFSDDAVTLTAPSKYGKKPYGF